MGTSLYWGGGEGGGYRTVQWVQACTGVKACTCREGYRGTSLDRGTGLYCVCVGGGGGVQDCTGVQACTRVMACTGRGRGLYTEGQWTVQFGVQPIVLIHSSCSFMMNSTYI